MRARHEQSRAGSFMGDVAKGEDQKAVVNLKMIDEIAADFPCGLEHDIDGARVMAYGASEGRGSELELQRSGFAELCLLPFELLAEAGFRAPPVADVVEAGQYCRRPLEDEADRRDQGPEFTAIDATDGALEIAGRRAGFRVEYSVSIFTGYVLRQIDLVREDLIGKTKQFPKSCIHMLEPAIFLADHGECDRRFVQYGPDSGVRCPEQGSPSAAAR